MTRIACAIVGIALLAGAGLFVLTCSLHGASEVCEWLR
jgi:hypothetical protein